MSQKIRNSYTGKKEDKLDSEIYMEYPFYSSKKPFLVKDLAQSWFQNIKDAIRPATYDRYHSYASKFILPYVGQICAEVFDKTDLSAMLELLLTGHGQKEPLSQYTVYFIENMVRVMFRYGAENGLVPEIYFGKSKYKIQSKRYAMPLSELEMMQLVHLVEQKPLDVQVQILLPLYTGISLSELCGLKWEDIDMNNGKIHVHRNLVRIQKKDGSSENEASSSNKVNNGISNNNNTKENNNVIKNNKKKVSTVITECELPEYSCRKFLMPEKIYELLTTVEMMKKPMKDKYVAELEKKKGKKKENTIDISIPPDARSLQYRLKPLGEEAGITDLTYQALRDTFAVLSLDAGGDAYSVAYVMGVGVNVICDRYGMWLMKNDGFMKRIR